MIEDIKEVFPKKGKYPQVTDYVRPMYGAMAITVLIKFTASISELFLPSILSYMVDDIAPTKDMKMMIVFGLIMIFCSVVALVGNVTANRLASKIASKITHKIRYDIYVRTISLSCERTDELTVPTLISRLTSDTYNLHNMLASVQKMGIRAPILVIGGVIITAFLDPILTLILVSIMPVVFVIIYFVSRKGVKLYKNVQENSDGMVSMLREHMEGIRVIKALSKTEYEKERFTEINTSIYKSERKAAIVTGLSSPAMHLFLNFGLTMVILAGAYRVFEGTTGTGVIIAFLSYFTIILNALMMVNRLFMMISKGVASGIRLNEVLLSEPEPDCSEPDRKLSSYHLEFENVTFSYLKQRNNIENLSFGLQKGGTVGIIGSTGSGKSTIVNLLLRFYQPDSGKIYIDGENIASIPRERFYSMIGSALQTDFLMSDTISENISFERGISEEDITFAATNAMADAFIREKNGGYDYLLDVKAANLSGGQKQRMLISRALASHSDILILDDSCGGLDYKTDSLLRKNLSDNYADCTKVIVAQRVSTIKNADIIIVMDDGKVIGMGTHEELLQTCDYYKETADAQMGVE